MLAELVRLGAMSAPDELFIVQQDGQRATRAEVDRMARSIGAWLQQQGVRPGDRVALGAGNSLRWIVTSLGINCAGAIAVQMPPLATRSDLQHLIADGGARVAFIDATVAATLASGDDSLAPLETIVGVDFDRTQLPAGVTFSRFDDVTAIAPMEAPEMGSGMLTYTAGTTGRAKGVYRDASRLGSLAQIPGFFDLRPTDVHLVAGALYYGGPSMFANISTALGCRLVVMERFDPEVMLRLIEQERVTTTFLVPTMLRRLTQHPAARAKTFDTSSLRVLVTAGEPCAMTLKRDTEAIFGGVLYEFGGASELGLIAVMPPDGHEKKPGSCGRIVPGMDVEIIGPDGTEVPVGETGEIHVRSSAAMEKYWNDPDATAQVQRSDFLSLGDEGYVDADGFLYITGRTSDIVKTGGVRVTPSEIEGVLLEHVAVLEAAVVGVPDERWGERLVACVLAQPGAQVEASELQDWCRERLAAYKVPKDVVFIDEAEWPRQPTGKVPKRLLRDRVARQNEAAR